MDSTTLAELERALAASPTNAALRAVIVRGWIGLGDLDRARSAAIEGVEATEASVRSELACALSERGRFEEALTLVEGDAPELLREKARALVGLRRFSEGRDAYDAALDARPDLADVALAAALATAGREAGRRGPSHLRVVSNDDTDVESVHRLLHPPLAPITFT